MVYHEKILNNLYESSSLERIRDLLLPKLISGDLRIQNNFGGNE